MSASDIVIRRAGVPDAAALLRYLGELRAEGLDGISNDLSPTLEQEESWIAETNKAGTVLVAEHAGEIIGLLDIRHSERPSRAHMGSFGMSVAKAWRRRGIGLKLLQSAIDEARTWPGFCRIELEVVPWNAAAIALYEGLGFRHEARKAKAINFRGRPEDMLLMALIW